MHSCSSVCSFAVANAIEMVKERADWITRNDHGRGVAELVEKLVASDLREIESGLCRHEVPLGTLDEGRELRLKPYGVNVLVAGTSGGGKRHPGQSAVVNLLAVRIEDRPAFFGQLLPRIQHMRATLGHPHWLVVDETHHLMPALQESTPVVLPQDVTGLLMITMKPIYLAPAVLDRADIVIAIGETPGKILQEFADAVGARLPPLDAYPLRQGESLFWARRDSGPPVHFHNVPTRTERQRHIRKYAAGVMPSEYSFYFTGGIAHFAFARRICGCFCRSGMARMTRPGSITASR